MKKKLALLLVSALTVTTLFAGCGKTEKTTQDTSTGGKEEITVWAWDPNYNIVALNEAKRIYEAENQDVTINVVEMAKADIEQKLSTVLASGSKEGLPDIVLVEDYNTIKYINAFPDAFAPYDNVDYSQFATSVDFMTIDGKTYGVPFGLATAVLYYRSDLFEQAGYSEADMENITWNQLIEMGKKVKETTGTNLMTFDPNDASLVRLMMQSAGSWYTDENGKTSIADSAVLKEAFATCKNFVDAGIAKSTTGWAEYVGSLNDGSVASVVSGCWLTPSIMAEPSQSGKWKIAQPPRMDLEGSVNVSNLGGSSWFVLNGDRTETAKDFIAKTFAGSTELYENILKNNGIQSMYTPAFESAAYQEPQEFFGGQKINALLGEWTKSVPAVNFGEYTWEADAVVGAGLVQVIDGADIVKTLKDAEEQFNAQIQ